MMMMMMGSSLHVLYELDKGRCGGYAALVPPRLQLVYYMQSLHDSAEMMLMNGHHE
jgi:hypothetical protein